MGFEHLDINDYIAAKCRICNGILANCMREFSRKDRDEWNEKNKTCTCGGGLL